MNRLLCLCFIILLSTASSLSAVQSSAVNFKVAFKKGSYKQGELIVKFRKHASAKSVHRGVGGVVKTSMRRLSSDLVTIPEGVTISDAIRLYQNDPNVEYAEPNYIVRKASVPNDPLFSSQWNMSAISAPKAWDTYTGRKDSSSIIVAVLDTGIDYNHPDLAANLWTNPGEISSNGIDDDGNGIVDDYYGANFNGTSATTGNPMDDDDADAHGTHVAGIIGAVGNNGIGVSGLNWNVRLMAVKFLHGAAGFGELADALKGIEYALSRGAKIINCSFEVEDDPSIDSGIKSVRDAINLADASGVLVVSAAGNTSSNLDRVNVFPASIRTSNNISVAATGSTDLLARYSDYGRTVIDLAAPGGDATNRPSGVLSTVMGIVDPSGYRTTAGTSMAAPHVSGLAALIWNMNPSLNAYQVRARIMNSVDKLDSLTDKTITGGRINAERALTVGDLPAVFSVTPSRVMPGSSVIVKGVNFGLTQGNISIGGFSMTVTAWGDSAISATIPENPGDGSIRVNGLGSGLKVIIPAYPSVVVESDISSGLSPLEVLFTATVSGADVSIVDYEWDFGDGNFTRPPAIKTVVSHTFASAGTFNVRIRITDDLGRQAVAVTVVRVTSSGSGGGGGGCFIATAAWGSEMHPRVAALRRFRDRYLMSNLPGRLFVKSYYRVSPPLADFIARHELLRKMVRWGLSPLVAVAERL
jgi:subtilisin family serine protease